METEQAVAPQAENDSDVLVNQLKRRRRIAWYTLQRRS